MTPEEAMLSVLVVFILFAIAFTLYHIGRTSGLSLSLEQLREEKEDFEDRWEDSEAKIQAIRLVVSSGLSVRGDGPYREDPTRCVRALHKIQEIADGHLNPQPCDYCQSGKPTYECVGRCPSADYYQQHE